MQQLVPDAGWEAKILETQEPPRAREHAHDSLFAEKGRERARAHLHSASDDPDPPFLRNVRPIGQEVRQNLESGDNVRRDFHRQEGDRMQDTVESPAQLQGVRSRLEVDVAGTRRLSLGQDALDHFGRISRIGDLQPAQHISQPNRGHCVNTHFFPAKRSHCTAQSISPGPLHSTSRRSFGSANRSAFHAARSGGLRRPGMRAWRGSRSSRGRPGRSASGSGRPLNCDLTPLRRNHRPIVDTATRRQAAACSVTSSADRRP